MSSSIRILIRRGGSIAVVFHLCVSLALGNTPLYPSANCTLTADSVLEDLRARRNAFITNGKFVDIFPSLYFSTTNVMIRESKSMRADDRELLFEQIVLFYEAFESNRGRFESTGVSGVESHWKAYYREALRLEKKKDVAAFDIVWLVLNGVDAHLNDLPRSLRLQMQSRRDSVERLKVIYFDMDKIFAEVVREFEKDVALGSEKREIPSPAFSPLNIGSNYVIHARHVAWDLAFGNETLKASKPQPRICVK